MDETVFSGLTRIWVVTQLPHTFVISANKEKTIVSPKVVGCWYRRERISPIMNKVTNMVALAIKLNAMNKEDGALEILGERKDS